MKRLFYYGCLAYSKVVFKLKYMLPYNIAKLHIAYRIYQATTMYRERLIIFGREFALESFVEHNCKFFLDKLTRVDKLKAFFMPYSCIDNELLL